MSMHDDDESRDDAPALPERDVLDAWAVPPVGPDLTDRVLGYVEAELPQKVVSMQERPGRYGLALVGVAMVAAAALVLGLVQLWQTGPQQEPAVAVPIVVRVPVPMPVPRVDPPPAVSVEPVPREEAVAPEVGEPSAPKRAATPKAKTAVLRIGTAPGQAPAKVYVDGRSVGLTPLMSVKVTPGRHTVEWQWSDGESQRTVVTLEAGETKVLKGPVGEPKDPFRAGP